VICHRTSPSCVHGVRHPAGGKTRPSLGYGIDLDTWHSRVNSWQTLQNVSSALSDPHLGQVKVIALAPLYDGGCDEKRPEASAGSAPPTRPVSIAVTGGRVMPASQRLRRDPAAGPTARAARPRRVHRTHAGRHSCHAKPAPSWPARRVHNQLDEPLHPPPVWG
jgi:hypothetical protein